VFTAYRLHSVHKRVSIGRADFKATDGTSKCRRCRRARVTVVTH